ncbi:MAG: LCP family protein [Defluviitaleaceae bacterium]|nr:LCP family protein [Defluviitaleaceae bacterium]
MNNSIKKFLIIVVSIVGSFVLIGGVSLFAHSRLSSGSETNNNINISQGSGTAGSNTSQSNERDGFFSRLLLPPRKTNFLILGNDQSDLLTDVIILGSFDRDTNNIDLISVPRDTYTTISQDLRDFIEGNGRWVPRFMKMNELHAYGGRVHGGEVLRRQLQEMFNIEIDYIISMELDGFIEIVDILGPVEFEVPAGGLFYRDPTQGLVIALQEGVQMLDGAAAEGLVRFRGRHGDLGRIDMQHEFMMEFFRQALQRDNIINNIVPIAGAVFEHVETDFNMINLPRYVPFLLRLQPENLRVQMLPGHPQMINGISYFIHDQARSQELINSIFHNFSETTRVVEPSDLRIQIFNAGDIHETVRIVEEMLGDGFNVVFAGEFSGSTTGISSTRVITPFNLDLEDVLYYFDGAEVLEEHIEDDRFDIIIIAK